MKKILLATLLLSSTTAFANPTGTWSITGTASGGSNCGKVDNFAHQWILTENEGKVEISVVGKTSWPELKGNLSGSKLKVSSVIKTDAFFKKGSFFDLDLNGNSLTGERAYIDSNLKHCTFKIKGNKL